MQHLFYSVPHRCFLCMFTLTIIHSCNGYGILLYHAFSLSCLVSITVNNHPSPSGAELSCWILCFKILFTSRIVPLTGQQISIAAFDDSRMTTTSPSATVRP